MTINTTPRFGLKVWSDDADAFERADFATSLNNIESLAARMDSGLAEDRPAAAIARRLHYATDAKELTLDTGAAWVEVAPVTHEDAVTPGMQVTSLTSAWRVGRLGGANVALVTTGALVASATLFTLPAGYRPPVPSGGAGNMFDDLVAAGAETPIRVHISSAGVVSTQVAIASGVTIRGTLTFPLPL